MADGPIRFVGNLEDGLNIQNVSRFGRDFSIVRVPYAFKLLLQEIQTMNVVMRIITEDNVDQVTSLSYSKNYKEVSGFSSLDEIKSSIKSLTGPSKISTQVLETTPTPENRPPFDEDMSETTPPEEEQEQEEQEEQERFIPQTPPKTKEYGWDDSMSGPSPPQSPSPPMEGGEKDIIKIDTEDVKLETDDIINLINTSEKENTITLLTDVQNDESQENESEESNNIKTIN